MNKGILIAILFLLSHYSASSTAVGQAPKITPERATLVLPPEKTSPVTVARFEKPPVIDGRLDDDVWKSALVLKDFYQIQPGDNTPPSKATEVLLGYDAKFLYIAFRAADEPDQVRATVAKRDAIFDDDYVGVFLDTYNDQRKAYELFFNPLGVQADGILTEGRGEDFSFDLVMDSKGALNPDGYCVEIAIPFKSLRYATGEGKLWGVHFQRSIKRFNGEIDSWMPISRERTGTLNQQGHITGFLDLAAERTLEIIPSLTISETGKRVPTLSQMAILADPTLTDPGRFVNEPVKFDAGVTVKYGITPTVTLDFAVNPDFAQIEADETVVTANQRFPIFFEEKRPFFLEGIDIFQTPLQVVHTRTIIDPDYAVKLSGKVAANTFGLMLASDNAIGNFQGDERLDPRNFRFLDKNSYVGVLRLKHDVGTESNVGMIATTYNFIERHNHVVGVDGRFRLDPKTVFSFQALGTNSRQFFFDPELGRSVFRTGNGFGYNWNYDKGGRHLSYNLSGTGRTTNYVARVGFTPRSNTNREDFIVRYSSEPKPEATLISWRLFNDLGVNFDWQGRSQAWINATQFRVSLPRQTVLNFGYTRGYERLFEHEFGVKRAPGRAGAFAGSDPERSTYRNTVVAYGSTNPAKQFFAAFNVSYIWNAFDFDFGAGPKSPRVSPLALIDPDAPLDPGPGNELRAEVNLAYQPTNKLRAEIDYLKDRLVRRDTGRVAFDDNIVSLRATYQFSRFTFFRARADYDSLDSSLRGQFLLGWTPNPGTSFYVGYNDDVTHNGFSPFTGQLEPGFRRNGRTFFLKASYLFRRSF